MRVALAFLLLSLTAAHAPRSPVPKEHPRLLGSRADLIQLSKTRDKAYRRMKAVAERGGNDDHPIMISMALVSAVERDRAMGRKAIERAMKYVRGPIRKGHVTFGADLARCALVYDLCFEYWTDEERSLFHDYMNKTVDANVGSETHVFHNGWYGYKNWGIGLACYATYHENKRAPEILKTLDQDYRTRTAPALELAGDGGAWAEGYYLNYFIYEWLLFCEVARRCGGVDYYKLAPKFYDNHAVAGMFATYPGIVKYNSRRPSPVGDGGGRTFGGDRDKALSARRIMVNRQKGDHQAVHTFNESTPKSSVGIYAYKDFLWRDPSLPKGDLERFRLSHVSPGPGFVYARSSWKEDATWFFFKCGDRFTAHQHLDNGNFLIFRHSELVADGGHYDGFGTNHDVNYHLRTIAHNTIRVHDPAETWPAIRAGKVTGNDGGQHHDFPHHNGAVSDADAWKKGRAKYDIADLLAFEDRGSYLYVAGDASRAYRPAKLKAFTRQIVYLRPGTFIIFDQVKSRFRKTWTLQATKVPDKDLSFTNGNGKLFLQPLLPSKPEVKLIQGRDLYRYGGKEYPPSRDTGPTAECRIEIDSKGEAFLNVLTATDADVKSVPQATVRTSGETVVVSIGRTKIEFRKGSVGGRITIDGKKHTFTKKVSIPGR